MSIENNKAIVCRFYEEVVGGDHDLSLLSMLVAEDIDDYHAVPGGFSPGRVGFEQRIADMHGRLPDVSITVDDMVAEGDRVVAFWTGHGTMLKAMMGFAPSGKPIRWSAVSVLRLKEDQITAYRARPNKLALMQEYGLTPLPVAPTRA
jgi:predicted ester cyclase